MTHRVVVVRTAAAFKDIVTAMHEPRAGLFRYWTMRARSSAWWT
ncbi:hypothetical protein ACFWN5_20970 [Streptomyces sp. NPDC058430]